MIRKALIFLASRYDNALWLLAERIAEFMGACTSVIDGIDSAVVELRE